MRSRAFYLLVASVIVIAYPLAYGGLINMFMPKLGFRLSAGWTDEGLRTYCEGVIWNDVALSGGWRVAWTSGQSNGDSGLINGTLYATFRGYNGDHERGVSGIMIEKSLENEINSTDFPYLVIRYSVSSSDSPLMFSFGITDGRGIWHDGGWRHVSASMVTLVVDLRNYYNGSIRSVSLRLTNDFDPDYAGGKQYVVVKDISICRIGPDWVLASNAPLDVGVMSESGTSSIYVSGQVPKDAIATIQRKQSLNFDPTVYRYLKVSIKTSSIDVAPRIFVWTDERTPQLVLLKTYNDNQWHNEIIDLAYFGINANRLYMIELGLLQVVAGYNSTVWYRYLSFNK